MGEQYKPGSLTLYSNETKLAIHFAKRGHKNRYLMVHAESMASYLQ